MKVRIGSRASKLAIIQSQMIIDYINETHPEIEVELITMKTSGDLNLNKKLDCIVKEGCFVKDLEQLLYDNEIDIIVHSFKDIPTDIDENFKIVAVSKREDARDVLVLPKGITEIDLKKPIGSSSMRRKIQFEAMFPSSIVKPIRGTVPHRIKKLDNGEFGGIILAYAGLKRLGMLDRVSRIFEVNEIIPDACQGIIAVQSRKDFDVSFLNEFNNLDSLDVSLAERSFVKEIGEKGVSSAAYAVIEDNTLYLSGFYVGKDYIIHKDTIMGPRTYAEKLGCDLAKITSDDCEILYTRGENNARS